MNLDRDKLLELVRRNLSPAQIERSRVYWTRSVLPAGEVFKAARRPLRCHSRARLFSLIFRQARTGQPHSGRFWFQRADYGALTPDTYPNDVRGRHNRGSCRLGLAFHDGRCDLVM